MFPSILDSEWFTLIATLLGAVCGFALWRYLARPKLKRFEGFLLGRLPDEEDERDFPREIRMAADQQPTVVDLTPLEPPIWNQGRQGSCVGHAVAADVQMQVHKRGVRLAYRVAVRFCYWLGRLFSGDVRKDTGTTARAALKGLDQYGYTFENRCPYNDRDFKTKPSDDAFADAKKHKIGAYRRVARTVEAVCAALAEGDPVLLGFPVRNFKPDGRGVIPMPAGEIEGGHEVLIVGYDKRRRLFRVRNSWGTGWGDKGRCWMHFDHVVAESENCDLWTIDEVPA